MESDTSLSLHLRKELSFRMNLVYSSALDSVWSFNVLDIKTGPSNLEILGRCSENRSDAKMIEFFAIKLLQTPILVNKINFWNFYCI